MSKIKVMMSCTLIPWLLAAFFASATFHLWKQDLKLQDLPKTHDSTLVTLALMPGSQNRTLNLKDFVGTVEIFRKGKSCEYVFAERIETVYRDGRTGLRIDFPEYGKDEIVLIRVAGTDVTGVGKSPRFTSK